MLTKKPREYIQLHRDTTVHSLTVQPIIKGGKIEYEDSPLVKAVKMGSILVIDEADKAPLHVTCILKSLIESGEMMLSDGRRIVSLNHDTQPLDTNLIKMHKDFRMIILANRPGFPFLGNDFFAILGDLLSCHPIDVRIYTLELVIFILLFIFISCRIQIQQVKLKCCECMHLIYLTQLYRNWYQPLVH